MRLGRTFVGPVFDATWIGGAITLPAALWLVADGRGAVPLLGVALPWLVLFVNQAHFAASTLRLYTKPGAVESHPFLAWVLPIASFALLAAAVASPAGLGRHLWALAMTSSPYHYSAQAFGLAAMYCYRSGVALAPRERQILRWACLMPFFRSLLGGIGGGLGLGWLLPAAWLAAPGVAPVLSLALPLLDVLVFALPLVFFALASRGARAAGGVPLLALLPVLANGTWFVLFDAFDAFVWATVFHGVQYLALIGVFHAREGAAIPGGAARGPLVRVAAFYAGCVALGYALFQCWPRAAVAAGFGMVESTFLVVAIVNIHHFVVDAFIWKLRKDPNYATVVAAPVLT